MDTLTPFPASVVYKTSGPMGGGFLYTTGAEADSSAVAFKNSIPPLQTHQFVENSQYCVTGNLALQSICFLESVRDCSTLHYIFTTKIS